MLELASLLELDQLDMSEDEQICLWVLVHGTSSGGGSVNSFRIIGRQALHLI